MDLKKTFKKYFFSFKILKNLFKTTSPLQQLRKLLLLKINKVLLGQLEGLQRFRLFALFYIYSYKQRDRCCFFQVGQIVINSPALRYCVSILTELFALFAAFSALARAYIAISFIALNPTIFYTYKKPASQHFRLLIRFLRSLQLLLQFYSNIYSQPTVPDLTLSYFYKNLHFLYYFIIYYLKITVFIENFITLF